MVRFELFSRAAQRSCDRDVPQTGAAGCSLPDAFVHLDPRPDLGPDARLHLAPDALSEDSRDLGGSRAMFRQPGRREAGRQVVECCGDVQPQKHEWLAPFVCGGQGSLKEALNVGRLFVGSKAHDPSWQRGGVATDAAPQIFIKPLKQLGGKADGSSLLEILRGLPGFP